MGKVSLKFEPLQSVGRPTGDVAYIKMPVALAALEHFQRFVEVAYGPDCGCAEIQDKWLRVCTPDVLTPGPATEPPTDAGTCSICGAETQLVRPGKYQATCRCWEDK
jgi:hypothetical protein